MKPCLSILLFFAVPAFSNAQSASSTWSVKFSDAIVGRYPPNINTMTSKGWEYSNGIILVGMEKVYEQVPANTAYLTYIQNFVDAYVTSTGSLTSSKIMSTLGLDGSHPGLLCLFLYQQTGLTKYKTAATKIRDTLINPALGYPRTPEGGYWHRNDAVNYKNVEYLDGIYMAQPFLAKYGAMFNDTAATDTAVDQTIILYNRLYSNTTHLVKHAFDYDKNTYPWAVPSTGVSTDVWSRGMGWFVMTIVEILRYLPNTHPKYATLMTMLNNLAVGIKTYQDPASKLWLDIVDSSAAASQNYVETSGSGMFIFALKTAIDSGWISSATYLPVVNAAWTAYKTYITTYPGPAINGYAGGPQITSFTPAMGVQNNYAAYVSVRPVNLPTNTGTGTQHPHGYAATLMAASAMEFPLSALPVTFQRFSASENNHSIQLFWENYNDNEVDHFEVQRKDGQAGFSSIGSVLSNGLGHYTWDDNPDLIYEPVVLYRIKSVSKDGAVDYSDIISLTIKTSSRTQLSVSPNPIKDGMLHLAINNLPAGTYNLKVLNNAGQVFETEKIDYTGGTLEYILALPSYAGKGIYLLQLNGQGNCITKKISIE